MHQLSLLTGGTNNAHNRVVGKSCCAANPSETAAFTMRLEHLPDLFWSDMAMVVQGVKPFIERLLALRTEISLAAIGSNTRVCVCWDDHRADIPSVLFESRCFSTLLYPP